MRHPSNAMCPFVLAQVDAAINLFTSLIQHGGGTPRYERNLQWLQKLRARAASKLSTASHRTGPSSQPNPQPDWRRGSEDREDGEDVELLGWRTRLIERAGQDRQTIRTIHLPTTPTGSLVTNNSNPFSDLTHLVGRQDQPSTIEAMMSSTSLPLATTDSTDDLVSRRADFMCMYS